MELQTNYQAQEFSDIQRIEENPTISLRKKKEALIQLQEKYKKGLEFFQASENSTGISIFSELYEKASILLKNIEMSSNSVRKITQKSLHPKGHGVDKKRIDDIMAIKRFMARPSTGEESTKIPSTIAKEIGVHRIQDTYNPNDALQIKPPINAPSAPLGIASNIQKEKKSPYQQGIDDFKNIFK